MMLTKNTSIMLFILIFTIKLTSCFRFGSYSTVNIRRNIPHTFKHEFKLRITILSSAKQDLFGFNDILSENEIELVQERYDRLKSIFHRLSESELRHIVSLSPLFLTIDPIKFENALKSINQVYPYIDPSYISTQKSPGLELLLLTMTGEFNFTERHSHLRQVIGRAYNITEFLHKVPHALTPRYALKLQDQIYWFRETFPFVNQSTIVSLIERCPSLLTSDLSLGMKRLNITLVNEKLYYSNKEFYLMIKNYPRVLIQDISKPLQTLKQTYTKWNYYNILINFPQILGINMNKIASIYRGFQEEFSPYCNVDILISKQPQLLQFNITSLKSKLYYIQNELPSCKFSDILEREPHLLMTSKTLLSYKLDKVRSLFESSSSVGGNDVTIQYLTNPSSQPSGRTEKKVWSRVKPSLIDKDQNQNQSQNNKLDILGLNETMNLTREQALRIAREYSKINSLIRSEDDEPSLNDRNTFDSLMKSYLSIEPATKDQNFPSKSELSSSIRTYDSKPTESIVTTESESLNDNLRVNLFQYEYNQSNLDLTRIVFGNCDMFINKYAYFVHLLTIWIESFDPVIAYLTLDAIPALLTKKSDQLRSVLKYLYGCIASGNLTDNDVTIDPTMNRLRVPLPVKSIKESSKTRQWYYLLLKLAPKLTRWKIKQIEKRLSEIRLLFEDMRPNIYSSDYPTQDACQVSTQIPTESETKDLHSTTRPLPIISAAKMITEPTMSRLWYRKTLLKYYIANQYMIDKDVRLNDQYPTSIPSADPYLIARQVRDLIYRFPRLLAQPSSILKARIPFATNITLLTDAESAPSSTSLTIPLSYENTVRICACNTDEFIDELYQLYCEYGLEEMIVSKERLILAYAKYLRSLLYNRPMKKKKVRYSDVDSVDSDTVSYGDDNTDNKIEEGTVDVIGQLEGNYCGLLNELCDEYSQRVQSAAL